MNYLLNAENKNAKQWVETTLSIHLRKNTPNNQEINHILDYINKTGKDLFGYTYKDSKNKANNWTLHLNNIKIKQNESPEDTKIIMTFSDSYKMVQLLTKQAFQREGKLMKHCIGGYIATNNSINYSLRDKNNTPHCTIEITNNYVKQIKGKTNGIVKPKYINYVLNFLNEQDIQIDNDEMLNIGYALIDSSIGEFICENAIHPQVFKKYVFVYNIKLKTKIPKKKYQACLFSFFAEYYNIDILNTLIKNTKINKKILENALEYAAKTGNMELLLFLETNGANIKTRKLNRLPLPTSAEFGHLVMVEYLIKKGLDFNINKSLALRLSAEHGHLDVVKCLIEKGANIHAENNYALRMSALYGHLDVVKYLVKKGADIHEWNDDALRMSAKKGHFDVAIFLIEKGCVYSQYHHACLKRHLDKSNQKSYKYLEQLLSQ